MGAVLSTKSTKHTDTNLARTQVHATQPRLKHTEAEEKNKAKMVFYFTSTVVAPPVTLFMGEDKHENESLIRWGWPEDVWFHVDKVSSAHVYLRSEREDKKKKNKASEEARKAEEKARKEEAEKRSYSTYMTDEKMSSNQGGGNDSDDFM